MPSRPEDTVAVTIHTSTINNTGLSCCPVNQRILSPMVPAVRTVTVVDSVVVVGITIIITTITITITITIIIIIIIIITAVGVTFVGVPVGIIIIIISVGVVVVVDIVNITRIHPRLGGAACNTEGSAACRQTIRGDCVPERCRQPIRCDNRVTGPRTVI